VEVHSLMTITEAAESLHSLDIITEEEYEAILQRTKK